jgi:hypothetical protein
MAFANFFDRALMSVSQALNGTDTDALQARLANEVIELAFDSRAVDTFEGQASLDLTVRLLSRLYPSLRLVALDLAAEEASSGLAALAFAVNPDIDLCPSTQATVRLVFGATRAAGSTPTIYAGSNGWLAKVSDRGPRECGDSDLPFGAGAAACLGAANVFRRAFADALPCSDADRDAVLSMFDFSTGPDANQGPLAPSANLGITPVVGLGAIGNGVVWALSRTPRLTGDLHLVDHEALELSNLQRYVLAVQKDVGRVKVEVARETLTAGPSSLGLYPFVARWADYVEGRGHPTLARAVVALDSARDRIEVQAALPARSLNAWTQTGDLGVSRHDFLGDQACLACLYMPRGQALNEDQLIAQALGLPLEVPVLHDLRERLINGSPVGEAFVRATASRLGLAADGLLHLAEDPLRQFYAKAVCGGQLLTLRAGRPPVEAPLAFQSAMAGVMLAAELVSDAAGLRPIPLPTKTILDLTRPLVKRLSTFVIKPVPGTGARCLCQDSDYVAAYCERHDVVPPRSTARKSRITDKDAGTRRGAGSSVETAPGIAPRIQNVEPEAI